MKAGKLNKLVYLHSAEKVKFNSMGLAFTDGSYSESVWRRYLDIAKEVTFIARKDDIEYSDEVLSLRYNKINEKIKVVLVEDRVSSLGAQLSTSKRQRNRDVIHNELKDSELLMIRVDCNEAYLAARVAQKIDVPYMTDVVGCAWDSLWHHGLKGKALALFRYFQMRYVVRGAIASLYVTQNYLQNRYPTKGLSVGCSDVALYGANKISREFKKKKVLKIGTISPLNVAYKNQAAIIRILRKLNQLDSTVSYEYHLVGLGDSSRLAKIAKKHGVQDKVRFIGQLKHDQISAWLKSIDIYAQPSKAEGLPRALVEALDAGCPSVGSDVGGISELLQAEALFKYRSPKSIIRAIEYISVPENAKFASKQGSLVASKFSVDNLKKTREDFYVRLMTVLRERNAQ